jgi:photosystem II stability/assembly factor-like uncharacterized protein
VPTLYVATNGLSVWTSTDGGETIGRMPSGSGLYSGSQVWSFGVHPASAAELLAGTDSGIYRLDRRTEKWHHIASPMDDMLVTAIAYSPADPQVLLAGTQPGALFRSADGGASWRAIETPIQPYVSTGFYAGDGAASATAVAEAPVKHWTRVTQIVFDPSDPELVFAGVEIDGVWRSRDAGLTWERVSEGLVTGDIHGFAIVRDPSAGRSIFATTCDGLHVSRDGGESWELLTIAAPRPYMRSIVQRPGDARLLFMTNGNGPPGTDGHLFTSRDAGTTWNEIALAPPLESSLYFLATNPADPQLMYAAANLGQIYRTTDGGASWTPLPRRLGEIRAITWLPDVA